MGGCRLKHRSGSSRVEEGRRKKEEEEEENEEEGAGGGRKEEEAEEEEEEGSGEEGGRGSSCRQPANQPLCFLFLFGVFFETCLMRP